MKNVNTLVLPGLDGTGLLLDRFQQLAPPSHDVTVLPLPNDCSAGYAGLCDHFSDAIESANDCLLIGESFSGPLAVLLAHRFPHVIQHLVLVASFATSPLPQIASFVPWRLVFRMPLPAFVAARYLIGDHKEWIMKLQNAICVPSPQTLAHRVNVLSQVNVTSELQELNCPITYLRPTRDALISNHHVQTLSRQNKRIVVRYIEGPHLILQTHPEQAWQHILEETSLDTDHHS